MLIYDIILHPGTTVIMKYFWDENCHVACIIPIQIINGSVPLVNICLNSSSSI